QHLAKSRDMASLDRHDLDGHRRGAPCGWRQGPASRRMPPVLYLVDASVFIFRAYYSVPIDVVDLDGNPVNAVHGFARFLSDLLQRQAPRQIAVAFDESLEQSYRNEIYPAYKANREP